MRFPKAAARISARLAIAAWQKNSSRISKCAIQHLWESHDCISKQ